MSGLPEGLITNTDVITGDIRQVDRVADEDIAQLWRVYTTNQRLLANNIGRRLENLFWRIWSNDGLRTTIRGSRVAFIFHGISEGDSMIRTTPTQSPRRDRSLPRQLGDVKPSTKEERPVRPLELSKPVPQVRSAPATTEHGHLRATEAAEPSFTARRRETAQGARPPPILKKSRGDASGQLSKTARILTPTWKTERRQLQKEIDDDESVVVSPSAASESEPSPNPVVPQLVIDETLYNDEGKPPPRNPSSSELLSLVGTKSGETSSSTKSRSKKPTFVANTASSKRRPQMTRRKSSNSSGPPSKAPTPSLAPQIPNPNLAPTRSLPPKSSIMSPLQNLQEGAPRPPLPPKLDLTTYQPARYDRPPSRSPRPPSARSSRSASPILSRPAGDHVMQLARDDGGAGTQSWLVDVDFKAKFANKLQQQAEVQKSISSTRSRVPTSPHSQQSESEIKSKGKGVMILGADDEEEGEGDPRESTSAIQSSDEEDDEQEVMTAVPTALQKTKSQLTLLLETERRREREREKRGSNGKGQKR